MFALNRSLMLATAVASIASFGSIACTQSADDAPSSSRSSTDGTDPAQTESELRLAKRKPKKPQACPPVAVPLCDAGTKLVETKDPATGCAFATCEKIACPEIDIPACASTDELVTGNDENGCSYAYCKPKACPPIDVPQCQPGQSLKYTVVDGCTFADCE